jgi:hypothetical protein
MLVINGTVINKTIKFVDFWRLGTTAITWPWFCGLIIQERMDQRNKCPGPNETGINRRRDGWSDDGKRGNGWTGE